MGFQKLLPNTSFSLFCWWSFIHQSLLLSCNGNTVFLAFPAFFRKTEDMVHFQIVYKGKICVTKKVTNIIKKLKSIRYASSGSVLPLLCNLSSRFAAILLYAQFLFLPLCGVIHVFSVMVNIILKIRNRVLEDNASSYTEKTKIFFDFYLHFKKKSMFSTLIDWISFCSDISFISVINVARFLSYIYFLVCFEKNCVQIKNVKHVILLMSY